MRPGELPETQVFGVPQGHWREYYNKELSSAAGDLVPTGEFDAGRALTEADQELAAAKSGADVQSAVVKLNGVRAHYGEAAIDDVHLARIMEERKVGDERAAIRVAINDTRRLLDADAEAANVNRLVAQREALHMELDTAPDEVRGDLEAQLADLDRRIAKADEPTVPLVRDTAADVARIEESVPLADKPETAPLNQVVEEKAVRITQGTPFTEDRARWLDFVRNGREAFLKNQGMSAEAMDAWVRQEHVADWSNKLAKDIDVPQAVPPTMKIEQERLFTPEDDLDLDFMRRVGTTGSELNDNLTRSSDPVIAALARDLARHKTALGLIDVHVRDIENSYADRGEDGRAVLKLRAGLRHDDISNQESIMMHELFHGLTLHELQNPANAHHVSALDALRQKVVDSLPKGMREVIGDMRADGWYERYARGDAKWDAYKDKLTRLGGGMDDMQTIYGVLTNDEFISQGQTSHAFRDHLAKVEGSGWDEPLHQICRVHQESAGSESRGQRAGAADGPHGRVDWHAECYGQRKGIWRAVLSKSGVDAEGGGPADREGAGNDEERKSGGNDPSNSFGDRLKVHESGGGEGQQGAAGLH